MEPLKPEFRAALKKAHPGLTDETINRVEALLSLRFQIDPEAEPERLQQIDRERSELIRRTMPRYEEVLRRLGAKP